MSAHTPAHHPTEALLLAYAAGASGEAEALMMATHLTLCPTCRLAVERMESVGGALIEAAHPEAMSVGALEAILGRLDEPAPPAPAPAPPASASGAILPAPLRRYVGAFDRLAWRTRIPMHVHEVTLPILHGGFPVRLLRSRAGWTTPQHTHGGRELSMVLTGGFTDGDAHFERGDFSLVDGSVAHRNTFDDGEDCVVLVLAEAPMVPLDLAGRFARLFSTL